VGEFLKKLNAIREKYLPRILIAFLWIFLLISIIKDFEPFQSIIQTTWITSAILAALLLISNLLSLIYDRIVHESFVVYKDQENEYKKDLQTFLSANEINKVQLIELSTMTIRYDIIRGLANKGCQIQLLVQHPSSTVNEYQRERIESALPTLLSLRYEHPSPKKFEVRLYKPTASIRGRKFDDKLISIGWYTYGTRRVDTLDLPEHIKKKRGPQEVDGHTNPLINADLSTAEGKALSKMFDRVFDDLWKKAIPLEQFMNRSSNEDPDL
jgi:hypothetical protein